MGGWQYDIIQNMEFGGNGARGIYAAIGGNTTVGGNTAMSNNPVSDTGQWATNSKIHSSYYRGASLYYPGRFLP